MDLNKNNFFINKNYQYNQKLNQITDDFVEEYSITEQPYVYAFTRYLGQKTGVKYIIDIGCSHHEQLVKLYPEFQIIGIGCGENLEYCKKKYSFGKWIEIDFTKPIELILSKEILKNSIILCTDVIEHLVNPTYLLNFIKENIKISSMGILTAIDRDVIKKNQGPPLNINHVREWNFEEFEMLISKKFGNYDVGLTINNQFEKEKNIIVSILYNDHKIENQKNSAPSDFSVTAIVSVFNEEDIVVESIKKILEQGVKVYVIDNGSTDKTLELIKKIKHKGIVGIEEFHDISSNFNEWESILKRKQEISKELGVGWYINTDIDEIRITPWPNIDLKNGIHFVDRQGFNAIDFSMIAFHPTDNNYLSGIDFEDYFKYFELEKHLAYFFQVQAWKNFGQDIDLIHWGGHRVEFAERKIFPLKFLCKHYSIRSQKHGERKIFMERQNRFHPKEIEKGWHAHYDEIKKGENFIYDRLKLTEFNELKFNKINFIERLSGIGIISEETTKNLRLNHLQIDWARMYDRVLTIGSATDHIAKSLEHECSITSIKDLEDISQIDLEFKRNKIQEITKNGKFDTIVIGNLFNQVTNPEKLLKNLKNILNENGTIIFYVENLTHATNKLKKDFKHLQNNKDDNLNENMKFYNIDFVCSIIKKTNYDIVNLGRIKTGIFGLKRKNIDPKRINRKIRDNILNELESTTLYYILKIKNVENNISDKLEKNIEFVQKCYKEFLRREADTVGLEHYTALLESKDIDKKELIKRIKESSEYIKIRDTDIFWIN
tara:strand:+ start:2357 stop:4681 length:2325 start_codon:yes stop_codon:yes gene_type:complete